MNINYTFVRHGFGCHNAVRSLIANNKITKKDILKVDITNLTDPELSEIGVDASLKNGYIIKQIFNKMDIVEGINTKGPTIVGCSPLIRSMETAYYMTREWSTPPSKIYVLPLLREIDESSKDKYSKKSRQIIDTHSSYAMKTIKEQKEYLQSVGILDIFDFRFVEKNPTLRTEPGDILEFVKWFNKTINKTKRTSNDLNAFIVTHAGVLRDYAQTGFINNSGFILSTTFENKTTNFGKMVILDKYLPSHFFYEYSNPKYANEEYYCPSNRCKYYCTMLPKSNELKKI